MNRRYYALIIVPVLILSACSQQPESKQTDAHTQEEPTHVWREKTKTIDQAKAVNQMVLDSATLRNQQIEADGQ